MDFPAEVPGRVSLVVPCYNIEQYFEAFLQSVLAQDVPDLEVILVNDGANEATTAALRSAVAPLQAKGWTVKLIEHANKGVAGAVDAGLKHVSGEFLMWPDPDDWLVPGSLSRRVQLMRNNPNVGLLRSNCELYIEAKQQFDGHFMPTDAQARLVPELFEDFIYQRQFYAPVCYFVRCSMFWQVHADRSIWFESVSSQNFQLLVPFVEAFEVLQVPDVLACYRVREDSRSRAPTKTHVKLMGRHEQLYQVTVHTLPKLHTYSPERANRLMNQHWRNKMLPTAIRAKMREKGNLLIAQSDLASWRRALARACLATRCNRLVDAIDAYTGRIVSRVLARTLDATVRVPAKDAVWGTGPLWGGTDAPRENSAT